MAIGGAIVAVRPAAAGRCAASRAESRAAAGGVGRCARCDIAAFLRSGAACNAAPALRGAAGRNPARCRSSKSARAHLSRELRCMVCQNQSIDNSDAPLARDLRLLVRERLKAGDSDKQVLDFLTARYGDFVLLKPPLNPRTAAAVGLAARRAGGRRRSCWCLRCAGAAPASAEFGPARHTADRRRTGADRRGCSKATREPGLKSLILLNYFRCPHITKV